MPSYKDENRGTWYCSFYYTDWTGKKKKKKKEGFKTQREAKAFEREFLDKSQASPNMTLKSLVDLYLEDCKSRLKPTTYQNKELVIKLKILPYFSDMPINAIEPVSIRKWQNELMSSPNNYSQTYLKNINNQFSSLFNFAVKYYKLPSNPVRICGSIGKLNADVMKFWTVDEFKEFLKFSDVLSYTVVYQILFWTGIRIGECLALTLDDIDLRAQTVSINKNYVRHEKQDLFLEPKTPKSKRVITLPKFLCEVIEDYLSKLYDYNSSDRIFTFVKSTVNFNMKITCKKSGVKQIRVHDLRHSHASLLIELGFSPLLISERLGHENIETTLKTYSHLYPNRHEEVASKLQEFM